MGDGGNNKKSIGGIRAYFIRGHGGWLLYTVWFLTNISILYVILGSELPIIQAMFGNIMVFAGLFVIVYIVIATIIGYLDIEVKGIYGQESGVYWDAIPQIKKILDMLTTLVTLCTKQEKRIDELEELIKDLSKEKE